MLESSISDLLRLCPEVVLNKYLAVTAIDGESSAAHLGEITMTARIGRSPIASASVRFTDSRTRHPGCQAGFDEWYVFERAAPPEEIEVFVNWVGFRLYDPEWKWCADR
jgi:hypothetical protein